MSNIIVRDANSGEEVYLCCIDLHSVTNIGLIEFLIDNGFLSDAICVFDTMNMSLKETVTLDKLGYKDGDTITLFGNDAPEYIVTSNYLQ